MNRGKAAAVVSGREADMCQLKTGRADQARHLAASRPLPEGARGQTRESGANVYVYKGKGGEGGLDRQQSSQLAFFRTPPSGIGHPQRKNKLGARWNTIEQTTICQSITCTIQPVP